MQFPKPGAGRTWLGFLLLFSLAIFVCGTLIAPLASAQTQTSQSNACVVALQPAITNVVWQNNAQTAGLTLNWVGATAPTAPAQSYACALTLSEQPVTRFQVTDLYPGVRLKVIPAGNVIGYELYFDRGASTAVSFDLAGANSLAKDQFGNIIANTGAGDARLTMPFVYQLNGTLRKHLGGSFGLSGTRVSFQPGTYDVSKPLVVNFWIALPETPSSTTAQAPPAGKMPKLASTPVNYYMFGIHAFTSAGILYLDSWDRTDGSQLGMVTLTEAGETLYHGTGLASSPLDGKLYAVLDTNGAAGRELVTIDPSTGVVTRIGDLGDAFVSITFAPDGRLFGMTGYSGTIDNSLFQIDPATAATSQLPVTMLDCGGDSIAYNDDDGKLYQTDCQWNVTYRIVDLNTFATNDVDWPTSTTYMTSLTYFPYEHVFVGTDYASNVQRADAFGYATNLGSTLYTYRGVTFPAVDLNVAITGAPDPIGSGNNITYTVTVTNFGKYTSTNTVVDLTLDANSVLVSATPSQGSCVGLTCTLGGVAGANGTATITVVATANDAPGGIASLEAAATSDQFEPTPGDEDVTYTANVLAGSSVVVGSDVNPSEYGQNVTFTGTVTPNTATGNIDFLDGTTVLGGCGMVGGTCTFTYPSLTAGTHNIVARYDGDGTYGGGTSTAMSQVVNQTTSTTALSLTNSTINSGQAAQMTATITTNTGGGEPTGTVTFFDGATAVGTANVVGGQATLSIDAGTFPPGTYNLTATYNGDANVAASTSTPATVLTVNQATTATSVTSDINPSTYGQTVTFTATVTITSGGGTPTGTVQFDDGGTNIGSPVTLTLVSGQYQATLAYSALTAGVHTVNATYSGDTNFATSTNSMSQTVNQNGVTNTLTSSVNPSVFGQSVTFTATLVPTTALGTGAAGPSGTVDFFDGATNIGTGTVGSPAPGSYTATLTTSTLTVATHNITATYNGDTNFTTATSGLVAQVVNLGSTTTTLTADTNPADLSQMITFTVTVAPVAPAAGTPTGTADIYDGATLLNTCALVNGVCTYQTNALIIGSHAMSAVYSGDANFATSTGNLTEVIRDTTVTTLAASATNVVYGQPITFDISVTSGSGTPTGYVTLYDGGASMGTATLSSGTAQLIVSNLPVGVHNVFATYSGDANFAPTSSTPITITVSQGSTTTVVVSSANPSVTNQSVTFTATVSPVAPSVGVPTGTVDFFDGATNIGTVALDGSGQATLPTAALTQGSHDITVVYAGDTNFAGSTSVILTQVVNAADFTVSYSGPETVTAGQTATYTVTVTPNPVPYNYNVTLACGTLPAGVTCSFNPNPVFPDGGPVNSTLTLTTTAPIIASAQPIHGSTGTQLAMWLSTGMFGLLGIVALPDKRKRGAGLLLLTLVLLMAIGLGCGGTTTTHVTPHPSGGTPAGTYLIDITVTGNGGVQHTMQVTLVVN